jgi:hypothetical protein
MPFSASTCVTNLGTTTLGPVLSAYTDADSYLNPFASVTPSQISSPNCPYVFTNIPDGTTNIRLIDPTTSCCITIPIQSSDLCNTCDLGFTIYSSVTNSQIVAGNLTGSCQANISDYVIHWTGPNGSANIAYTSGKGSTFASLYTFTHPLTGSSAIFSQQGTYVPVIDRVIISGITFSNTGGTGTYDATLDCFDAVQVNPLTCNNGNTPTSAYTHSYYFSGTGASAVPLNVTFLLSANTKYFAYSFTGVSVPDSLKITYSGSNTTPNQLILENVSVGTNNSASDLFWSSPPRTLQKTYFNRVLCLTGITRSSGDFLTIQITPNPGNTEWAFNCRCFENFDCSTCPTTTYRNTHMKLVKSEFTATTDVNNCFTNVQVAVSACTFNSISGTNLWKYYNSNLTNTNIFNTGNSERVILLENTNYIYKGTQTTDRLSYTSSQCSNFNISSVSAGPNTVCRTGTPSGTITFTKNVVGGLGRIYIESTNFEHISYLYTNYLQNINDNGIPWRYSACTAIPYPNATGTPPINGPFSGGTFTGVTISTTNPYDPRYYRGLILIVPTSTGNTSCGGNSGGDSGTNGFTGNVTGGVFQYYRFHISSPVITGTTGPNYYLQITMNTGQTLIDYSVCRIDCNSRYWAIINQLNLESTGTSNNVSFTNSTGAMITTPFGLKTYVLEDCSVASATSYTGKLTFQAYSEITMPTNPSDNSIVPIYSGTVCQFPFYQNILSTDDQISSTKLTMYNCKTVLLPTGPKDYEIYCSTISNWSASTTQTLAYVYSANTQQFCNPTFVIGC